MIKGVTHHPGEVTEIPIIEQTGKYYRGFVHEVHHQIKGSAREIYIDVHPSDDYYYKWVKMRE